jgi:hypothetical protein
VIEIIRLLLGAIFHAVAHLPGLPAPPGTHTSRGATPGTHTSRACQGHTLPAAVFKLPAFFYPAIRCVSPIAPCRGSALSGTHTSRRGIDAGLPGTHTSRREFEVASIVSNPRSVCVPTA